MAKILKEYLVTNRFLRHLIITLVFGLTVSPAWADYHYASHQGSDEYPYTSWETAAALIQDALNAAEAHDTLYVGQGVWTEADTNWTHNLAIIGMGMHISVLENYDHNQIINYGDTVLIEGFSFISDWEIVAHSGISCRNMGYVIIRNNYFSGNNRGVSGNLSGYVVNNIFEENCGAFSTVAIKNDLVFANNTVIHDGWCSSFLCDDLHEDSTTLHIRNNVFFEGNDQVQVFNFFYAVNARIHNNIFYKKIHATGPVHFDFGYSSDKKYFYNNTIDGTSEDLQYAIITGMESNVINDTSLTIDNNIIVNCEVGVYNERAVSAKMRYNNLFNIEIYFEGLGEFIEGNVFADPMFMDSADFYLQAFSPDIDAGDPDIFDPDGSRSDIGAYGGSLGETYEYFDLPPRVPDSLRAEVSVEMDTIYIFWRFNTESDFSRYQIHRDTLPEFDPDVFNLIAEPDTALYIDVDFDLSHSYFYKIAAIDDQDNISEYSEQLGVIFTGMEDYFDPNMPRSTVLYQNYPNPFNQETIIKYYLPNIGYQPAEVKLEIYDILGRAVRTLVDERQYPGEYSISWDGKDERREDLPSGVYFGRLFVSRAELTKPMKLMLIR